MDGIPTLDIACPYCNREFRYRVAPILTSATGEPNHASLLATIKALELKVKAYRDSAPAIRLSALREVRDGMKIRVGYLGQATDAYSRAQVNALLPEIRNIDALIKREEEGR